MSAGNAWIVVLAAIAATYAWRGLGVALSSRMRPEGAIFQWVSCVSYAMLAGLIARMTVLPLGELADVALGIRLTSMGVALVTFFALGRRPLVAVVAGVLAFMAMTAMLSP